MSHTGESLESATQPDSISQTIYPDHQIELEALANQTPIDIQHMLDNLPEPDVTEQRKRKTITQGLFLHADHNYLSMPNDIEQGKTIGPDFILNGSMLYKTYIQNNSLYGWKTQIESKHEQFRKKAVELNIKYIAGDLKQMVGKQKMNRSITN